MKISDLIQKLEAIQKEHGNLDIVIDSPIYAGDETEFAPLEKFEVLDAGEYFEGTLENKSLHISDYIP